MTVSEKRRNFCITSFNTANYKAFMQLKDDRIRLLSYQLETADTGKVHLQVYLETYGPLSRGQVKKMLNDNQLHIEPRGGPRYNAYMYTKKEDNPWWHANFPQWKDHGARIPGTEHKQIGYFSTRQGERTDIQRVVDAVEAGKTESEIADMCPREFIKFGAGINRLLAVRARKLRNKYNPVKVIVRYGDTRSQKTRKALDEFGYEKVFSPTWNGSKFWWDGYEGEKVIQINEIDKMDISINAFQRLTDDYIQLIEYKGGVTASNWDTIILTSNVPPNEWFNHYEGCTEKQVESVIERIDIVEKMTRPSNQKPKTWADLGLEVADYSITIGNFRSLDPEPFTQTPQWLGPQNVGENEGIDQNSRTRKSTHSLRNAWMRSRLNATDR